MNVLETMKQALEALEEAATNNDSIAHWDRHAVATNNLRAAIEQYEAAEPVAEVVKATGSLKDIHIIRWLNDYSPNEGDKLYTAPAGPVQELWGRES